MEHKMIRLTYWDSPRITTLRYRRNFRVYKKKGVCNIGCTTFMLEDVRVLLEAFYYQGISNHGIQRVDRDPSNFRKWVTFGEPLPLRANRNGVYCPDQSMLITWPTIKKMMALTHTKREHQRMQKLWGKA